MNYLFHNILPEERRKPSMRRVIEQAMAYGALAGIVLVLAIEEIGQTSVQICDFKTSWDIWRTMERHFMTSADYILLEQKATALLGSSLAIERMVAEAKDISKQFSGITAMPLTPEHVMGLLFSLAAQSDPKSKGGKKRVRKAKKAKADAQER